MFDLQSLTARLAELAPHSPRLQKQLAGVDIASLKNPADFAKLPLLRKSDLSALQREDPPFAGIAATAIGFKRLFMSPGPIFEGEDLGDDPYGAKAAFVAAGVARGEIVLNCFSYHLTPGAFIIESGAHAAGCAVIPAGPGNTEQTLQAIAHLKPSIYAGPPDFFENPARQGGGRSARRLLDPARDRFGRRSAADLARGTRRSGREDAADLRGRRARRYRLRD